MEQVRVEEATAALRAHLASWPYAFAMAGGPHGAPSTRRYVRCAMRPLAFAPAAATSRRGSPS